MRKKAKISRFKIQRRLMLELPGLGKAGALERRPYPPGEHGTKRAKYSEFRLQLEEKQKLRFHYNIREEQLVRIVKKAKATAYGPWVNRLINLLEKRLENVVFRAGMAPSMAAARQLVSHGKILVNSKKVDIGSYTLKKGDVISVKAVLLENAHFQQSLTSPRLELPDWLSKDVGPGKFEIRLSDEPEFAAVPFALDEGLVTSYYSKV